jgi:hypothetical protein
LRFGLAVWPELVATGWGSLGFTAEVGVRYRAVSLGFEAHGDPSLGSIVYPQIGAVRFARASGALLACGHYGWFSACGLADAGRLLFPDHIRWLPAEAPYLAAGARARMEFPVRPPWLFLSTSVDLRAPLHPASTTVSGAHIFDTAGLGGGLGIGLAAELPP